MASFIPVRPSVQITRICTAPQKLDMKNLTFGMFFNEINL